MTRESSPRLQRFWTCFTKSEANDKSPLPLRSASVDKQNPFQLSSISPIKSSFRESKTAKLHICDDSESSIASIFENLQIFLLVFNQKNPNSDRRYRYTNLYLPPYFTYVEDGIVTWPLKLSRCLAKCTLGFPNQPNTPHQLSTPKLISLHLANLSLWIENHCKLEQSLRRNPPSGRRLECLEKRFHLALISKTKDE